MRWFQLTAAVVVGLCGCRGEAVDAPTESDTGTSDSGTTDSVGDASASNLLNDGTFELGCADWMNYYSTVADETVAHSTPKACRVCRSTNEYFYVAQDLIGPRKKGQRFLAKAWVRSVDGKAAPATAGFVIEGTDARDVVVEYVKGPSQPVTATWTEVQAVLQLKTDAAVELHVRVGSEYATGDTCFIVDDASLTQLE